MPHIELLHPVEIDQAPDLIHRVRGLAYFRDHVTAGIARIAGREGIPAHLDEMATVHVFLDWIRTIQNQRAASDIERSDYISFSAGVLLAFLLAHKAIRVEKVHREDQKHSANSAAEAFPEGYLAMSYCMTVLEVVRQQEHLAPLQLSSLVNSDRVWWSFRENVHDDPMTAIGYFDLFLGNAPVWENPLLASARPACQDAQIALH